MLAEIIIREENAALPEGGRSLSGKKYVAGIIEVATALRLLEKFGPKYALSSEGYACHALHCVEGADDAIDKFLLERVIEADGEYALNVLRIVSEGVTEATEIGQVLVARFFDLINYKKNWIREQVRDRYSQQALDGLLMEAKRKLEQATKRGQSNAAVSRSDFFLKHTVKPRLEWLEDLGCLESGRVALTAAGNNLLAEAKRQGRWMDFGIVLPLNPWLATELNLANIGGDASDFAWKLVASTVKSPPVLRSTLGNHAALLERVKEIYPAVRMVSFNEADAISIYEMLAADQATLGCVLREDEFNATLRELVDEFPSEIFKLTKRRGRGMYVALKKT